MINYIRINKVGPDVIISTEECKWNDEKYLKPLAFEPWLMFGKFFKHNCMTMWPTRHQNTQFNSISDFDCLEPADGKWVKTEQDQIRELVETVSFSHLVKHLVLNRCNQFYCFRFNRKIVYYSKLPLT